MAADKHTGGKFSFTWLEEVDSTQRVVAEEARRGAAEGMVVAAASQTAGRGRRGRSWSSPPGFCLTCSILLRPSQPGFGQMAATALAAVEACEALSSARPVIKWPNDLLLDGRKLAGILADACNGAVVVGLGLNVEWPVHRQGEALGFAALSDAGPAPDRQALLGEVLARLPCWLSASPTALLAAYRSRCDTLGRDVRVHLADGQILEGLARNVSQSGELLLEDAEGNWHRLAVGDVEHLRSGGTNSDTVGR